MSFPKRKPADVKQAADIIQMVLGSAVKVNSLQISNTGTPGLLARHKAIATRSYNACYTWIKCSKNTANAVLDTMVEIAPVKNHGIIICAKRY